MNILRGIASIGRRLALSNGVQPPAPFSSPVSYPPSLPPVQLRHVVSCRAKPLLLKTWQERHWEVTTGLTQGGIPGALYTGFYLTAGGRKYRGLLVETASKVEPYIFNPPKEDIRVFTGHERCFWPAKDKFSQLEGIYFVHLASGYARSVDEAILNIEDFLNELERSAGWPKLVSSPVAYATAKGNGGRP